MGMRPGCWRGVSEDPALALRPSPAIRSWSCLAAPPLPVLWGSALEVCWGSASPIFGALQRAVTVAAGETEEGRGH